MAPKHSWGRSGSTCKVSELREISHYANQARLLISPTLRASQLCKLIPPKHSRGRSGSKCEVSELRKISHYANQPCRSPGVAGWLTS